MIQAPSSVLSRELLPASISVFATAALASFQALGIAAALPDISADLGNVALLPWAITAFLLTSSLATVVAGPFIDSVGVSRMFRIAVTVFTTMGFASAFAPGMEALVAFRALQGVGAGLILSTGTSAISLVYPQHLVGRAYAANATVWGVMGVAGPAIAALILTFFSWEWIFYVNLPLGVIALIAGWKVLPGPFGQSTGRFDLIGAVLLAVLTVSTLLAVDALSLVSLVWLAVAGLTLVLYVRHARSTRSPVVRLEHIVHQPYRGLAVSTGLMLVSAFAMSSYIPLYVRAGLGESPGMTAWSVLPLTVGWTTGAIISSRLADRHSESWIILLGFMVSTPSLALTWYLVNFEVSLYATFALFFITGVGVGLATNAALTLLRAVTDSASMGRVVSAHLFARNQGFTFGAAIGGAVLFLVVTILLGDVELVRDLISNGDAPAPAGAAEAVRSGFAASIAVGVVLSLLGGLAAVQMRRSLTEARLAKRGV
ncbi:MAG: MFS transporter [Actinobacteria bacterium]|nr:MFS transporter [Actinomycetota bacterium]MCI0678145.1 MFS transporter [Actinomycetota bacterium]